MRLLIILATILISVAASFGLVLYMTPQPSEAPVVASPAVVRVVPVVREPAAIKGDRLSAAAPIQPTPVVTVPAPVATAPEIVNDDVPLPPTRPTFDPPVPGKKRPGNVCTRTGGRKVVTNSGRSWHCEY